jgi:hypothetical protein
MAGRDISVTHEALGTVRVMKTGGMIGEVVGKAASICVKNQCTPRAVYERYFPELQELLALRGAARRETVNGPITLPDGYTAPPPVVDAKQGPPGTPIASLPGVVIDDAQAKTTGKWTEGSGLPDYVGNGYRYRSPKEEGTARYEFKIEKAGVYEVRMNYSEHENRASNAPVAIECAEGTRQMTVNERIKAPLPHGFISLGKFRFEPGKPAAVVIGAGVANGNVAADAVQLLPAE